jgi:hypothetical protein
MLHAYCDRNRHLINMAAAVAAASEVVVLQKRICADCINRSGFISSFTRTMQQASRTQQDSWCHRAAVPTGNRRLTGNRCGEKNDRLCELINHAMFYDPDRMGIYAGGRLSPTQAATCRRYGNSGAQLTTFSIATAALLRVVVSSCEGRADVRRMWRGPFEC